MRSRRVFILLAVFVLGVAVLWRTAKAPCFQFFGDLYCRIETPEKVIAITFDDGPNAHNTLPILNLLDRFNTKATFFMVGQNIAKLPEMAKIVLARGHQIANHSYSHQRMVFKSPAFTRAEIEKTNEEIRKIGFNDEIVFRPPNGKRLLVLPWILSEMNIKTITWDAESEDSDFQDPKVLEHNVLSKVRPGSIILFHDGGAPKPGTISAVENVLNSLVGQGFKFVTVNELLRNKVMPHR